ncbi:MAG TPA: TonB-dependent receptor [Bacteroidales bacterium]|nr:TonB-dependent receptor [Bacteroidales bacterium]
MKKIFQIVIIFSITLQAFAQSTPDLADTSRWMSRELQEIVIKASKDNVTHKTIPASVSVIPSEMIKESGIRSLNDLSGTAPNFYMPDYGSKLTSPVYIRGIGSRINSPSVGLYVDYVPYFEKAAFDFDFFDIQRIEVLRGPQGTLFGRNTMGGIVNIVTTSPMDYQGSHINLSAGNYGSYSLNAGHYGKAGDKFGYSLAANALHNDGFYTNLYTGNQVDRLNSYGFRNRLIYELSKKFTIENIAGYESSRQGGYPYSIFNDSLNIAEKINYNQFSSYDRDLFSDALLARYTGSNFEIMSTTSFQYLDDSQKIDQDFTPDSLFFVIQNSKQNMFSQEIVARSSGKSRYKWLFGGYAFSQAFDNSVDVDAYAQFMKYLKKYDHRIMGAALFHQSSISDFPVKNMTLTAGIRVDSELDRMDYFYDRTLRGKYALLADTLYPELNSMEVLPRFAINYKLKSSNLYAVVARGYKTGGFNSTFERPEDLRFDPEYSWNYETGVKTSLFNNTVYTDLSVFYIDWKNQQIYQTVPSGRGSMLKNAGHSVSKGIEFSLKTASVKGFDFMLSYGYTDARFISYVLNTKVNYNGNYLPYVPRNTFSAQAGKTITFHNSSLADQIRISAIYRGAGKIFWEEENLNSQPFYGLLDARISVIRDWLQFDIWAKNILNTQYSAFFFEALGNKYVQTGKPAQIGVNVSLKF